MEMNSKIDTKAAQGSSVLQYDDQFPPLPTSNMPKSIQSNSNPKQRPILTHNQTKSSNVTQTLVVPLAERRFTSRESSVHNDAQKKICQNVAQKCGVSIEMNAGLKDQNLSLFISGQLEKVLNARKILSKELQTQCQCQVKVPKEYHKFILGRNGASLREIEGNSSTNITIPRTGEESDLLTIYGTKEGIERAKADIGQIVSERSKLGTERLVVPRRFYPFILGPNNSNLSRIKLLTNAKVNIPPPQADNEEIVISGEKEGVLEAAAIIRKIYNDAKSGCSTLNLPIPKSQHRYVIGPKGSGLTEILEKTGVSVEVPSQDSDDDTIVLFGPNEQLAPALSLVIQKSESMLSVNVEAPNWLHRFIIGKSGSSLNKILENYERVFVNFQDDGDFVVIEGPKEDVKELKVLVERRVEELKRTMAVTELQVDPRFHRHIIGRGGANIQRVQEECKVQIRMPVSGSTGQSGWLIRIEGDPEGVKEARRELEAMGAKFENEKRKDVILDHKFHNQLIGAQGSKIKELRAQFPEVVINFPETSLKSDIVQLRGARQQVDELAARLKKVVDEAVENSQVEEVRILKQYHKNIIGRGGANVRKIREENNVRVDFPEEQSDSDVVRLTGKKKDVREAARRLEELQAELVNVKEVTVSVPHRLHSTLIGVRGKLIRCVQEECGGVIIQFPPSSDVQSDSVVVRGAEADVEKARRRLLELSEKHQLLTYEETVAVKSDYHKFIVGRKGGKMAEFRRRHGGVMVVFPDSEDVNRDVLVLVGPKEAVGRARAELETMVKAMEDEVEQWVSVDPKWHGYFLRRRQAVLEELSREFGGVRLVFPKGEGGEQVRVVGPKGCVEAAVAKVREAVENLEAQTSIQVFIEQRHHRSLLTRHMAEIKAIQSDFEVTIKFPSRPEAAVQQQEAGGVVPVSVGSGSMGVWGQEREAAEETERPLEEAVHTNGHGEELAACEESEEAETSNPANWVTISGHKEMCEKAKECLMELVPVSEEVPLPNEYHRNLIGQKGQGINTFSSKYNVTVNIPQASKCCDFVTMKGTSANLAGARAALVDMAELWDKEKQDRIARSYEMSVDVPVSFHRQIIGQRGSNIEIIRNQFNVNIQIPDQNSGSSMIVIRGYEEDANKAGEQLCAIVARLEAQVKEELHIPRDVHPVLIGTRGINLRKLREQFKVEINFPNKNAEGEKAELVEVIGDKEDVDKCCDHLVERANELLEEFNERNQMRGTRNNISNEQHQYGSNSNSTKIQSGFTLAGAPWQQRVPDAHSNDDFPTIDAGGDARSSVAATCLVNGHSE